MKKLLAIIFSVCLLLTVFVSTAKADEAIDNAFSFLKSKQETSGKIVGGYSAPSQWSAIAFQAHGIDTATIKTASTSGSLRDYLVTDVPSGGSAATEWESRLLAIVAVNGNPTNFGGVNYVQQLESYFVNGQIGDEGLLNDDIYGLLALVAAGDASSSQIKQTVLDYIISKQDADKGFNFQLPFEGCSWCSTDPDTTAAALQALQSAKDNGFTNPNLDIAITNAKEYLLANRNAETGAFKSFGFDSTDTTAVTIMAFNVLGMENSPEATAAKTWLLLQQQSDGGILGFASTDSTTTAYSLIALAGKGFIVKIFDPATASSSAAPTVAPTAAPTSAPSNNSPTATPTPTPTSTPSPTTTLATLLSGPFASSQQNDSDADILAEITTTPAQEVLGTEDEQKKESPTGIIIAKFLTAFGFLFVFIYLAKRFIIRKFR